MPAHDLPLLVCERARLVEDAVPNADFSEVMKCPGCPQQLALGVIEIQALAKATGQVSDVSRVRLRIRIPSVKGLSCQREGLIFQLCLLLNVRDLVADGPEESEESWRHNHSDGSLDEQPEDAAGEAQHNGRRHGSYADVLRKSGYERSSIDVRERPSLDCVVERQREGRVSDCPRRKRPPLAPRNQGDRKRWQGVVNRCVGP